MSWRAIEAARRVAPAAYGGDRPLAPDAVHWAARLCRALHRVHKLRLVARTAAPLAVRDHLALLYYPASTWHPVVATRCVTRLRVAPLPKGAVHRAARGVVAQLSLLQRVARCAAAGWWLDDTTIARACAVGRLARCCTLCCARRPILPIAQHAVLGASVAGKTSVVPFVVPGRAVAAVLDRSGNVPHLLPRTQCWLCRVCAQHGALGDGHPRPKRARNRPAAVHLAIVHPQPVGIHAGEAAWSPLA